LESIRPVCQIDFRFEEISWVRLILSWIGKAVVPELGRKLGFEDEYGQRYIVTLPIMGINGNAANVPVAWIVRHGTVLSFPHE
jgi:hypothetical protein